MKRAFRIKSVLAALAVTVVSAQIAMAGSFIYTGSMKVSRNSATSTLLNNGKVLVAGGANSTFTSGISAAEIYDPLIGTWTLTQPLHQARWLDTATLLPNGKVLVVGGT